VTIVFGVPITLAICTLSNILFVFGQFEFYFSLLYIFYVEYISFFLIRGCIQAYKEHCEGKLGSVFFNIPDVFTCVLISEFRFRCIAVDGVVHIF
jgi:hypothetical protein